MSEDDVVKIGVVVEGGSEAADKLDQLANAVISIGEVSEGAAPKLAGAAVAADSLTTAAESNADAVARVIGELKQIGEEAVAGFQKIVDETTDAEEMQAKLTVALEEYLESSRKIASDSTLPLEQQKEIVDELESGLRIAGARFEELGGAAGIAARAATSGFENVDRMIARASDETAEFVDRMANGEPVSRKALERVIAAQVALNNAIAGTGKEVSELPPLFQKNFDRVNGSIDKAKAKFGTYQDDIKDVSKHANELGVSYRGLGQSIEDLAGKQGKFVGYFAAGKMALSEGLQMGMAFNRFMRTDMSEWEKMYESFGLRANLVIRGLSDNLVAFGNVIAALVSRDWAELKRAAEDLAQTNVESLRLFKSGFSDSDAEVRKVAKSLGVLRDESKETAKTTTELSEAQKAATEAARQRAVEEEKIAAVLAKISEKQAEIAAQIAGATVALEDADTARLHSNEVLAATEVRLREAERAYREQSAVVKDLSERYSAGDQMMAQAEERQRTLEAAVNDLRAQQEAATIAVDAANSAHAAASETLADEQVKTAELTEEKKKAEAQEAKIAEQSETSEFWRAKAKESTGALRTVYLELADSADKATTATEKSGIAAKTVADPVSTLAEKGTAAASGLSAVAGVDLSKQATDAEKLAKAFERIASFDATSFVLEAAKLRAALEDVAVAADAFGNSMNRAASAGLAEPGGSDPQSGGPKLSDYT